MGSGCVPEAPVGGGGGMYEAGDPGPPCWNWKDAPEDRGGGEKEEEDTVGRKGGWEGGADDRGWLMGGGPG